MRLLALLLLSATADAPMPVAAREQGVVTLAADAENRWVDFELTPGNQIRFAMTLDGRAIVAVLDTGVSFSVLARRAADAARVQAGGNATAIGGVVPIGWMPTRTLALGGLTRRGGGVAVAELPALATGGAAAVDLLAGRDLLGGQALDIDYPARRFRLLPSGRLPFRGATAPLAISAERRVYESVLTLGRRRLAPMVVDTGDGSSVTVTEAGWRAAAAGTPTTSAIAFGLAGPVVTGLAIVPEVTLGSLVARQVEVRIEPADGFSQGIGVAGRIGSGFLGGYRVLLDPGAGRMVLAARGNAPGAPVRSTSGLLLGLARDRLRVLHVMRGGPAERSGWRTGEEICAIDGRAIPPGYVTDPLAGWTAGAPGTVVRLSLCDGSVRPLTLARFY